MGIRLSKTFIEATAFSLSNEDSDYPRDNAVNRLSSQREARTTDTTEARLVLDLLATQTDIEVILDNVNFPTFKYQESADGSTGWADIGTTVTVSADPVQGVYRRHDQITMTGKRYLGILVSASQTPTDGSSVYKFGTVAFPTNVTELNSATQFGYPFAEELEDTNIIINTFADGSDEEIKIGELIPMTISAEVSTNVSYPNIAGTIVQEFMDYVRDKSQLIYLDFNLGETFQAYLVKNRGRISSSISTPNVNTVVYGTLLFKVVI